MNKLKNLQFEINLINDPDIRKLVTDIFNTKVPYYFWKNQASSSGKYHPLNVDGTPESLVDHTKSVVRILLMLINHPMVKIKSSDRDLLIAAALLHDAAKYGLKELGGVKKYTVDYHPLLVKHLFPYEDDKHMEKIFKKIIKLVEAHSGPWRRLRSHIVKTYHRNGPCVETYIGHQLPRVINKNQYYLHMADFLASRRIFHVDHEDTDEVMRLLC